MQSKPNHAVFHQTKGQVGLLFKYRTTIGDRVVQTFNQPDFARPDNRVSQPWYSQQARPALTVPTQ